jgi:hypothetical protein
LASPDTLLVYPPTGCIAGISLLVGEIGILDPIEALRYE